MASRSDEDLFFAIIDASKLAARCLSNEEIQAKVDISGGVIRKVREALRAGKSPGFQVAIYLHDQRRDARSKKRSS